MRRWLLVIAALALVTLLLQGWAARRAARSRTVTEPSEVAGLDVQAALGRGVALAREGHPASALPYLRRALALRGDQWQIHFALGSTLFNTAGETRTHRGVRSPMTRSSWERLTLIREALERLDSAGRLATGPHERAEVADLRSLRLMNWGLSWDALHDARSAMEWDPTVRAEDPILRAVGRAEGR